MSRARNADHAARTCERFVYPVVKITRLPNMVDTFTRCAKVCGLFFLIVLADWLGRQTPIT